MSSRILEGTQAACHRRLDAEVVHRNSGKLAIILGAGASHDCADPRTAADVNEAFRPPLTKDIFSARFDDIVSHYPRVQRCLDELRVKLRRGGNFEEIFQGLLGSAERHGNCWPLQIPLYLRELFWTVSVAHLRGSSKFDTLIRYALESSFEQILFINLNYDLFFEDALKNHDLHKFESLSSYVPPGKKWLYVKPHGSVNWARIIENCPESPRGFYHPTRLDEMPIFTSELTLVRWNMHSGDFYIPGGGPPGYLYPQVVVPTERPKGFACPQDHIDRATTFLKDCRNLLLIGFSARDTDILGLLRRVPANSRWGIVGRGDARTIYKRLKPCVPVLAAEKAKISLYDRGFSKFVGSKDFERFMCSGSL